MVAVGAGARPLAFHHPAPPGVRRRRRRVGARG